MVLAVSGDGFRPGPRAGSVHRGAVRTHGRSDSRIVEVRATRSEGRPADVLASRYRTRVARPADGRAGRAAQAREVRCGAVVGKVGDSLREASQFFSFPELFRNGHSRSGDRSKTRAIGVPSPCAWIVRLSGPRRLLVVDPQRPSARSRAGSTQSACPSGSFPPAGSLLANRHTTAHAAASQRAARVVRPVVPGPPASSVAECGELAHT